MPLPIQYKKLAEGAQAPKQGKAGDAGYDLFALENTVIKPFERKVVRTGIAVEIPEGYYGRVAPRSGLAVKKGIDVLAGVIDSGYRDEVGVVLINFNILGWLIQLVTSPVQALASLFPTEGQFEIKKGDRIAQIIIEKCHEVDWQEKQKLSESERGTGGFGHTGT